MSKKANKGAVLKNILPERGSAIIGIVVIAILAFSLGLIMSGGEATNHDHAEESQAEPTMWTCSMHPQIKLPKKDKCPICFMDMIPLESSGDGIDPNQIRMSETARQLASIEVTPVKRAFGTSRMRMVGKIAYDETELAYITARIPGRLDKLHADFLGVRVATGDRLAEIYSPELLSAQEELLQARNAISSLNNSTSRILKTTANATLDASREKLRLYGFTKDQIDEIESTGKTSDHMTIYSPIGGVVVDKYVLEGAYVSTGTRIYTISDLTKLWAVFEAYESDLPWLRYGQRISFTSLSLPGETFEATISFIEPVVDPNTRTVKVRATVDNPDYRLKPDMFVRGIVESRMDKHGKVIDNISDNAPDEEAPLVIPITAALVTGKRAVVYVEIPNDEGPLFEGREIELGPRAGDFYIVKSGLEEGELVVTNGAFKIDSELQIQAKPSMMSPEGGAGMAGHQHGKSSAAGNNEEMAARVYKAGTAERLNVSRDALTALSPVYEVYFEIQMALAGDDLDKTTSAYERFVMNLQKVPMSVFSAEAHDRWMMLSNGLSEEASKGKSSQDFEAARDVFFHFSNLVIELHDTFGHAADEEYYLTYCPMARDNKGAFWLQTVDTIYNSFYGASMLRCGVIKGTLESGNTGAE